MSVRVLIVDDLTFMRIAIREAVEEAGFVVTSEARNGWEALIRYTDDKPDVVLLDIAMPVMDGITALKKLMLLDPTACVVMCSALGEQEMIVKAIKLGARDFVVKPFRKERIASAITKAVKRNA
ncbi:MAG: response regulator [Spirochaetaceae bacterium]|nr:MAG: response regulator [Spirochaetaceae bacterium]